MAPRSATLGMQNVAVQPGDPTRVMRICVPSGAGPETLARKLFTVKLTITGSAAVERSANAAALHPQGHKIRRQKQAVFTSFHIVIIRVAAGSRSARTDAPSPRTARSFVRKRFGLKILRRTTIILKVGSLRGEWRCCAARVLLELPGATSAPSIVETPHDIQAILPVLLLYRPKDSFRSLSRPR